MLVLAEKIEVYCCNYRMQVRANHLLFFVLRRTEHIHLYTLLLLIECFVLEERNYSNVL